MQILDPYPKVALGDYFPLNLNLNYVIEIFYLF